MRRFDWSGVDWARSNPEIALQVGAALGTVVRVRTALRRARKDIPRAPRPGLTADQRRNWAESMRRTRQRRLEELGERIRPLAASGMTAETISRELGVSADRVRTAAQALGIALPSRRRG